MIEETLTMRYDTWEKEGEQMIRKDQEKLFKKEIEEALIEREIEREEKEDLSKN